MLISANSCKQGDADAQFNLGLCYANGDGVEQDDEQAAYWWRKAADQGLAAAQRDLDSKCSPKKRATQTNVEDERSVSADSLRSNLYVIERLGIRFHIPTDMLVKAEEIIKYFATFPYR